MADYKKDKLYQALKQALSHVETDMERNAVMATIACVRPEQCVADPEHPATCPGELHGG